MSQERQLFRAELDRFVAEHPASQGWRVDVVLGGFASTELSLHLLPMTLRLLCAGSFAESVVPELSWHSGGPEGRQRFTSTMRARRVVSGRLRSAGVIRCVNGMDIERPQVAREDVVLPAAMKNDLVATVDSFLSGKARYRELGLPYRRGLLFVGPPGCGKTATIKGLCSRYRHLNAGSGGKIGGDRWATVGTRTEPPGGADEE